MSVENVSFQALQSSVNIVQVKNGRFTIEGILTFKLNLPDIPFRVLYMIFHGTSEGFFGRYWIQNVQNGFLHLGIK